MAWVAGQIRIGSGSVAHTADNLNIFAASSMPNAVSRVGDGLDIYVTLLYHGHPQGSDFKCAVGECQLADQRFDGVVESVRTVCDSDAGIFSIVLVINSESLQDFYATLRSTVEARTGEKSMQRPHTGLPNEKPPKNGFSPHVTLAYYATEEALNTDLSDAVSKGEVFRGERVSIGDFVVR